jgi:hypothetical protein
MRHPHEGGLDAGDIWTSAKGSGLRRYFDIDDFGSNYQAANVELIRLYDCPIKDIRIPPTAEQLTHAVLVESWAHKEKGAKALFQGGPPLLCGFYRWLSAGR